MIDVEGFSGYARFETDLAFLIEAEKNKDLICIAGVVKRGGNTQKFLKELQLVHFPIGFNMIDMSWPKDEMTEWWIARISAQHYPKIVQVAESFKIELKNEIPENKRDCMFPIQNNRVWIINDKKDN